MAKKQVKEEAMPPTTSSGPIVDADPESAEAVFHPTRQSLTPKKDKKKMKKDASQVSTICEKILMESDGKLNDILKSVENSDGSAVDNTVIKESTKEEEIVKEKTKCEDDEKVVKEAKKDEDKEDEDKEDESKDEKEDKAKEATPEEIKNALMDLIDVADKAKAILGLVDGAKDIEVDVDKVEEFEDEDFMGEKKDDNSDLKSRIRKHLEKKATMREKKSPLKEKVAENRQRIIKEARKRIRARKQKLNESKSRTSASKLIKESLKRKIAKK